MITEKEISILLRVYGSQGHISQKAGANRHWIYNAINNSIEVGVGKTKRERLIKLRKRTVRVLIDNITNDITLLNNVLIRLQDCNNILVISQEMTEEYVKKGKKRPQNLP